MNTINFNQTGGFPLSTLILSELQTAFSIFNALGAIAGDKTIISGCNTTGSLVSPGVVCINGEVLEFRQGTLPGVNPKVKIIEAIESLLFEDNVSKPVIRTRHVQFGTGVGAMDWADFKRPLETKNLADTFAEINTSLTSILNKLNTIDSNAKVQVPADWDANTGVARILNKPQTISFLHKGTFAVTDPGTDSLQTVTFPTVGTNNYMVIGSMVSNGNDFSLDNDVIWMIRDKQNSSFKITLREIAGHQQNLSFEYMLVPL